VPSDIAARTRSSAGRQVELAQGDAVDAAFGEQAFGGQDQPVAAVPCIASKRLSLHETD